MPTVSVIIPYYNSKNTILRALDSVRNQTYEDWEVILINDGSQDNSEQIINDYIKNHKNSCIINLYQTNAGPSAARNNGIHNAKGKYIAFLDSDDEWEPEKLAVQIDFMERNPDVALTGTNYHIVKDSSWTRYATSPPLVEPSFNSMLFKVVFLTSTVIVRRNVLTQNNLWFRVGKNQAEDLLLFLQIIRLHRCVRLSQPLANYFKLQYGEAGGLTADLSKLLFNELDNLKILYDQNENHPHQKISWFKYNILVLYSYLKHLKRVIRVKGFNLKYRNRD